MKAIWDERNIHAIRYLNITGGFSEIEISSILRLINVVVGPQAVRSALWKAAHGVVGRDHPESSVHRITRRCGIYGTEESFVEATNKFPSLNRLLDSARVEDAKRLPPPTQEEIIDAFRPPIKRRIRRKKRSKTQAPRSAINVQESLRVTPTTGNGAAIKNESPVPLSEKIRTVSARYKLTEQEAALLLLRHG